MKIIQISAGSRKLWPLSRFRRPVNIFLILLWPSTRHSCKIIKNVLNKVLKKRLPSEIQKKGRFSIH
jgi:hypothetical protein